MSNLRLVAVSLLLAFVLSSSVNAQSAAPLSSPAPEKDGNTRDWFQAETIFSLNSDFRDDRLGDGDSVYSDFTYDHRFLVTGKWYFRAGVEYERYDFGGTDNGLPNHLQAAYAHLAIEYVVHDFPALSLELDPGFYFQNRISGDAFDIPCRAYVTFPLQKDKVFGVIGFGAAIYQDPVIAPGGGIIWLISDKLRLQAVIPRPSLVYDASEDWQFQLAGELISESFRTDDVVTPLHKLQVHDAVVEYNENRGGVKASYSGLKPFKITATAGYTFRRYFDFFRHGVRERVDPAPFFGISIEAKF